MKPNILKATFIKSLVLALILLLAGSGWLAGPAAAQTAITVGCNTEELIAAIAAANSNGNGLDTIQLAPDCTYPMRNHNRTDTFNALPVIVEPLRIEGQGAILSGNESGLGSRHFHTRAPLTLVNVTLRRGVSSTNGGAIFAEVELKLVNVKIESSKAGSNGGGIYVQAALSVENSQFVENSALNGNGGGISANSISDDLLVLHATFVGNTAGGDGGAIFARGALSINQSTFTTNTAGSEGGAIAIFNQNGKRLSIKHSFFEFNSAAFRGGSLYGGSIAEVTLAGNTFRHNQAPEGSGLFLASGISLLTNNLWADNYERSGRPQANTLCLLCSNGTGRVIIRHDTLANVAPFGETAIRVNRGDGKVEVINTIIANYQTGVANEGGTVTTAHNLYFGNAVNEAGNIPLSTGHVVGQDPRFVSPAQGDYHLQAGSPAINKATDAGVTTDHDGALRPIGPGFDIGAFEFGSAPAPGPGGFSVFLPLVVK